MLFGGRRVQGVGGGFADALGLRLAGKSRHLQRNRVIGQAEGPVGVLPHDARGQQRAGRVEYAGLAVADAAQRPEKNGGRRGGPFVAEGG